MLFPPIKTLPPLVLVARRLLVVESDGSCIYELAEATIHEAMSPTAIASISDDGAATDVDIQTAAKRLDSGRSIGSDDTASTDPSSTVTYDDQYDPYNKSSGANSSGGTSVRALPSNPWTPKTARNSSTKKSGSVAKTTTRLRRSRSDEDLERLETFVQKAEEEHGLVTGESGGSSTRNTNSSSSAPTNTVKATTSTGRGDGAFDDDLQAMMNGVEERRRARREAAARVDGTKAGANNGSIPSSRGRLDSRRDDIGTQKMARRRSSSAPCGSNRSLFSDDDEDTVHSNGDYRKTIRWTDHHGENLEDVCLLDPTKSEGGMRRAEKARRSLYGDDDDYLEEDEEVQYDSDETPSSEEDGDDFVGDDGNGLDNDHAEVSMVFDTQFIESDDIDLDTADASLSLVGAMAAFSSPPSESNPGEDTSRNDDSRKKGGAGRRSRRPKRDQVQEGSFTLDDLSDVQAIATAVTGGEPDAGASTSCFGEVSMDLSEISAEMNDELNYLQPIANKPKKTMPSITEDSMNVFPDPELVTSKDKAINSSVNAKTQNDLPVPTSVVMQPLAPARKKRSSFTSPTSSPNAAKAILATKPIDILEGGNDSFADFANWGNDSFDANTSSSYKTTKKQQRNQQQKTGNTKREPRSNPAATTVTSTSTPTRPATRPNHPTGTSNNSAGLVSTAGGRPRKGPSPSQGRQPRPPGSKGPAPPSRYQPQQQRQQHGRRSSSDNRERPRRSSSTNSDTARKAAAAAITSSSSLVSRSNTSSSNSSKPSKGKSILGGLFTRNNQTSKQSKKLVGDEEVGILGHVDSSLGDSLNSLGDLAGLDSYFDPPAASSRLAGGNPNAGSNLAASIARNSQRQQQQRRRNNMKGRSIDDSDAALFAHINDGQQSRQSRRDSLDDLFVKDKW